MKRLLGMLWVLLYASTANAATWYEFQSANSEATFFFDADSVTKDNETIRLWIRILYNPFESGPFSPISKDVRFLLNCRARTTQTLEVIERYIDTSKDLGAYSGEVRIAPPESMSEVFLTAACKPDFPQPTHPELYVVTPDNDTFQAATDLLTNSENDPAPRSKAVWYGTDISSNSGMYFFDRASISYIKEEGEILLWTKFVHPSSALPKDGTIAEATWQAINCRKNSLQSIKTVLYGSRDTVKRVFLRPGPSRTPSKDTVGNDLILLACTSDFPKAEDNDHYAKVLDGDVYGFADRYFAQSK
jgi:hypothetical protein